MQQWLALLNRELDLLRKGQKTLREFLEEALSLLPMAMPKKTPIRIATEALLREAQEAIEAQTKATQALRALPDAMLGKTLNRAEIEAILRHTAEANRAHVVAARTAEDLIALKEAGTYPGNGVSAEEAEFIETLVSALRLYQDHVQHDPVVDSTFTTRDMWKLVERMVETEEASRRAVGAGVLTDPSDFPPLAPPMAHIKEPRQ